MKPGFSRFCRVGEGLFEYDDVAGAIDAIDAINSDYRRHSRVARMVAAEYFGSDPVISALMAGGGRAFWGGGWGRGLAGGGPSWGRGRTVVCAAPPPAP